MIYLNPKADHPGSGIPPSFLRSPTCRKPLDPHLEAAWQTPDAPQMKGWRSGIALPPEKLYRRCDLTGLVFDWVSDLSDPPRLVGQDHAIEAVKFSIGIRRQGFNREPDINSAATLRDLLVTIRADIVFLR